MKYCSMTGADNTINPEDLLEIGYQYPFVEWGILYSEKQMGTGRYPSYDWMSNLTEKIEDNHDTNFALHICGSAVIDFLNYEERITKISEYFHRIQLNFRYDSGKFDLNNIQNMLHIYTDKQIIFQYNHSNKDLVDELDDAPYAILFDSSGGRGIVRTEWPEPIEGILCGYAGGLGPNNVVEELNKIKLLNHDKEFYIDMEGKLRNDKDEFDLERVRNVLQQIS